MANHPSALKRNRQSIKRRARNRVRKNDIATLVKKIKAAPAEAGKLASELQSKLGKAAQKGTLHWKTAARKLSRIAKALTAKK